MSVRSRLVALVAVLSAFGVFGAGVATYAALRSFLYGRVDQQLDDSVPVFTSRFQEVVSGWDSGPGDRPHVSYVPAGTVAELRGPHGDPKGAHQTGAGAARPAGARDLRTLHAAA